MICQPPSSSKGVQRLFRREGCCFALVAGWLFLAQAGVAVAAKPADLPAFLKAGNWTVAPIANDEGDGRKFCSAKTSYGATVAFVFARDSGGGQSLAFEFPDKMFAAGATVPVLLAAGEVQYPLNALAATNRVLLIGIVRDSEIEESLRRDKPMLLQIDGRSYLMSLSGFSPAVAEVDACLAALQDGKPFAAVTVKPDKENETFQTVAPAVHRDITRLRNVTPQEIESFNPATAAQAAVLQDEIRRLRQENQKLLIEKQAAESQLLAAGLDDAPAEGSRGAVAEANTAQNAMQAMPPYVVRADKQILWPPSKSFADMVATYMTTEAARCPADFAQTPGAQYVMVGGLPVQEAEIACLGLPKTAGEGLPGDYAGALLFVGRQGRIDVIAHQGPAGMIEQALQARAAAARALGVEKQ